MSDAIERHLLEAYSRGEITRREIAAATGRELGFGALLGELHRHGLPLPRRPSDHAAPGVRLIKELTERAQRRAG